jgi:apolipoprotein N-acyltransferase
MSAADQAPKRRGPSLSQSTLKKLSFAHSTVYICLLVVWLVPGLAIATSIFGFVHGIGWILMVLLILLALRARVVTLRTATAVAVLGGIAPFFGSYEFFRTGRGHGSTGNASGEVSAEAGIAAQGTSPGGR